MCTLGKEIQEEGAVSDVTDESPSTVFVTPGGDQSDSGVPNLYCSKFVFITVICLYLESLMDAM